MRFKDLALGACFVASLLLVGCGGGGGGGGGGSVTTAVTVSGSVDVPAGVNETTWSASIKPAFNYAGLTATALAESGAELGSIAVGSDKSFKITLSRADNNVTVKVTNSKGFDFRKNYGVVGGEVVGVTVSATSTAELILKNYGLTANGSALTSVVNALVTTISGTTPPASGKTIYNTVIDSQDATLTAYKTAQTAINSRNAAVETALKNADVTTAASYFSPNFGSTNTALQATVNLDNFKTVSQDRFNKYTISSYSFTITSSAFTDAETASVTISARIIAEPKAGSGGVSQNVTISPWVVIWHYENGNWFIYRDFPYLKEQVF